jgi:chaperone modulatory protein CbpM
LQNLGINDEAMPIILDLIDQLHGLRGMLRELLTAIKEARQEH